MESTNNLREFSQAERTLLTEYTLAFAWDVSQSFRLVEQTLASNLLLHYAVPAKDSKLTMGQLDSLGEEALKLRDSFRARLEQQGLSIKHVAIAVQILGSQALLGLVDRRNPPFNELNEVTPMELPFTLEPTASTEESRES